MSLSCLIPWLWFAMNPFKTAALKPARVEINLSNAKIVERWVKSESTENWDQSFCVFSFIVRLDSVIVDWFYQVKASKQLHKISFIFFSQGFTKKWQVARHIREIHIWLMAHWEKYREKIQTFPDMGYVLQVHVVKIRPPLTGFKKNDFPIR